ncbi:DUF695 domain-containing protein [Burkholderiaceae bacterium DAT-1]|nr:DUF695 domain-containing protein [Burkholderiaceae bacterium DAT-1]
MADCKCIPSADVDEWTIVEGMDGGRPHLVRFRPRLTEFLGDSRFPKRLQIAWKFVEDESGMPSEMESDAMNQMEDYLVSALESKNSGILALACTSKGFRYWQFYVSPAEDLGITINDALAALPQLPITIELSDDPEWNALAELFDSVLD